MDEALLQSATDAAHAVSCGKVSAQELTELLLRRIDAVDPALNAVVELRREAALDEARAADEALARGALTGPLHGVPMTIKEGFDVAGLHTTWGNPELAGFRAGTDATVVRRLRDAGAIVVGKTNVAFLMADFGQSRNPLYGATCNPWDTSRSPGGSSGGGAAAVAAALSFLEYGSDLAGSIRIPAGFCGVYGLRPSAGVVPPTGFRPPGPPAPPAELTHFSAVGPLARAPADLRTALLATAGPEGPAAQAWTWRLPPPRHTRLADFRVGVVLDDARVPVAGEAAGVLSDAVDALAQAGATVLEGWPEGVDPAADLEAFGAHVQAYLALQHAGGDVGSFADFVRHEDRRLMVRAAWHQHFFGVDVLLAPVTFTPAVPHDTRPFELRTIVTPEGERRYDDLAFWVSPATLAGIPTVTAPVGRTPAGLPVGMQIMGPLFEDDTPITFADALADVVGGYEPPPDPTGRAPQPAGGRGASLESEWLDDLPFARNATPN